MSIGSRREGAGTGAQQMLGRRAHPPQKSCPLSINPALLNEPAGGLEIVCERDPPPFTCGAANPSAACRYAIAASGGPPRLKCRVPVGNSLNGLYGISTADRPHSALMPADLITLAHFSVSSAMNLPKSAGEPASTVPPRSASRALILGSARAALIPLLSLSTISTGVAFGAPTPNQKLPSYTESLKL